MSYQPQPAATCIREVDLSGLDALPFEALALFCWSDAYPLAGVCAYVDWRLCGGLSQAIKQQFFAGGEHDVVLIPAPERMGRQRLFVFGLGTQASWSIDKLADTCKQACLMMQQAGASAIAFAAPYLADAQHNQQLRAAFVDIVTAQLPQPVEYILLEKK